MVLPGCFPGALHCFRQLPWTLAPGTPGEANESAPGWSTALPVGFAALPVDFAAILSATKVVEVTKVGATDASDHCATNHTINHTG